MKLHRLLFLLVLVSPWCAPAQTANFEAVWTQHKWERALFLLEMAQRPGKFLIAEQDGRIWQLDEKSSERKLALDLRKEILSVADLSGGNEEGLLGMALHPSFPTQAFIYLYSSRRAPERKTLISKLRIDPDTGVIDPASEQVLYSVEQPYSNHKGGMLLFDSDGLLYVGVGDGGSAGDPQNNAQNLQSPLGKILRFRLKEDGSLEPAGVRTLGAKALPEIFAFGARNPWRFSIDPMTKLLWAGDVGQNAWEEIHSIHPGDNLGWRLFEGRVRYDAKQALPSAKLKEPELVYDHSAEGGISVTGGYVYRGPVKAHFGQYIFADYGSGHIWSVEAGKLRGGKLSQKDAKRFGQNIRNISSFAVDHEQNLYAIQREGSKIFKLIR
jgi:glucose/arabinose dehydrogenase